MAERQTREPVSRQDNLYGQRQDDPYLSSKKYAEPTVCPDCGAVFHKGHWGWGEAVADSAKQRCPACSRIQDQVPAGILTLEGDFLQEHKQEILTLIHHKEQSEKNEHALERIMDIDDQSDPSKIIIRFTGIHLTKSTGQAVHNAYQGDFEVQFGDRDSVMRASWKR